MCQELLSFPARFSNTTKNRIFRRLRLFHYPFYQLQIFYIEAICCALEPERITPSFNTNHQSYSPESSSSFILPPSTHHKKTKNHIFAPDTTIAPPYYSPQSCSTYRYSLTTRQHIRSFSTKIAIHKTPINISSQIIQSTTPSIITFK